MRTLTLLLIAHRFHELHCLAMGRSKGVFKQTRWQACDMTRA